MPSFASIDVGSNACRLQIAEAEGPDRVDLVEGHRAPVRLGHAVFLTGRLDPDKVEACVTALKEFRHILSHREIAETRAVVTASARDAVNSEELIGRVRDEAGIELEAISGSEEARLVKLAVESRIALGGYRSLLIDLGGGSLELSEVHHDQTRYSTSLEIGTVRLLESFLHPRKPVDDEQEGLLTEYIERLLDPVRENFRKRNYDVVAGTGGNFDAIAKLCPSSGGPTTISSASDSGGTLPAIDVQLARALLPRMKRLTVAERQSAYDLRADRADVIVPALYVVVAVADLARTDTIVAPGVGLREGILVELINKYFSVWDYSVDESAIARSAVHLGRRYHFDEPHGTQVDRLACQLFDQLAPVHELGPLDRRLLRAAALLHDIGDFVASAAHHKHTQYIIEHTDLMGLSRDQRQVVACIARYHRRALPSTKHALFKRLTQSERKRVRKLAAILRVADALDRGHRSKVREVSIDITPQSVRITPNGSADLALEVWTARRKAELFEKVFERKLDFNWPAA